MKKLIFCVMLIPVFCQAQSVGIGTTTPHSSAMLDVSSNTKGMLVPRMRSVDRIAIQNPEEGLLVFDNNTLSFWVWLGVPNGGWSELSTPNNGLWVKNGTSIYNSNSGNVGIGTTTPEGKLHIVSGFGSKDILFSEQGNDKASIGIAQFQNFSSLELKTIDPLGRIDLTTAKTELSIMNDINSVVIGPTGYYGSTLMVSDIDKDPEIQFIRMIPNGGGSFYKGFIQIAGDNIRIGTNSENTEGKFVIRTSGSDKVAVDKNGNMGIGTLSPASKLDVSGDISLSGEVLNIAKTGSANLLPICYGNVKSDGTINTGSNNFSVNRTGVGTYYITITGNAFHYLSYLATVTPAFLNSPQIAVTTSFNGDLIVRIFNVAGNLVDGYFNFVVHKP